MFFFFFFQYFPIYFSGKLEKIQPRKVTVVAFLCFFYKFRSKAVEDQARLTWVVPKAIREVWQKAEGAIASWALVTDFIRRESQVGRSVFLYLGQVFETRNSWYDVVEFSWLTADVMHGLDVAYEKEQYSSRMVSPSSNIYIRHSGTCFDCRMYVWPQW